MREIGGDVDDRVAIGLGALLGAVAGAALGYLYLTPPGRRLREDLEPELSELVTELQRVREVAERPGRRRA